MIFVAVTLLGMLAVAGLVIDGGSAYAERRQMQNAADASALAGANELQRYRSGATGSTSDDVYAVAAARAIANGAGSGTKFTCQLVLYNLATGAELGTQACPTTSAVSLPANALGVRVRATSQSKTSFMGAVGVKSFRSNGTATANLERAAVSAAPFLICANAPGQPAPLLILPDANPDAATVNPAAIGLEYDIWGNAIKLGGKDCGNPSSSFRGLLDPAGVPYAMPGWWDTYTGNKNGQVGPTTAGGCGLSDISNASSISVGCELALPLCTNGQGNASSFAAYCVRVGRFRVTHASNHDVKGVFIGGGVVLSGAGHGLPTAADAVVIHLIS
jgi:Flp pilus assembly protein TadG